MADSQATIITVFDELRGNDQCMSIGQLPLAMRLLGMNPTQDDVDQLCPRFCTGTLVDSAAFLGMMQDAIARWLAKDQAHDLLLSFQAFDTHANGRISVEKLTQIMSMAGNGFTSEELEEMLQNAGVDRDGTVAYKDIILKHFLSAESGAMRGDWSSLEQFVTPMPPLQEATTLSAVAKVKHARGGFEEAILLYGRSLAILESVHGAEHPDVAATLHTMAGLKEAQGEVEEALAFYCGALDIREKVLGPTHFYVAMSLDSIANLKDRLELVEEALDFACRSLAIWEKVFGPTHPHIAKILFNLAERRDSLGQVEESEKLYRRALGIWEAANPEGEEAADTLNALANLRERMGDNTNAQCLYERELAIRERLFGASNPQVLELRDVLACLQAA